jgi:hypothetical protein
MPALDVVLRHGVEKRVNLRVRHAGDIADIGGGHRSGLAQHIAAFGSHLQLGHRGSRPLAGRRHGSHGVGDFARGGFLPSRSGDRRAKTFR